MERITVAMLCASAPPVACGVGDYTAHLVEALSAAGIDVVHFASRHDGPLPPTQATAANQCRASLRDWRWSEFAAIRNELEQFDPDILHIQFPAHGYNGHLLTRVAHWFRWIVGRPVVMTLHEHVPPHYLRILASYFAASAIISVRPDFRAGFKRLYSWPAALKPFHFIPNAASIPPRTITPAEVDSLRSAIGVSPKKRLVAHFGLVYPRKGTHHLFEIADASSDHLLIIGGIPGFAKEYGERVIQLTSSPTWRGSATMTGLLSEDDVAKWLAAADAVVLPFTDGGGVWNTSIHAARLQGTLVLTTSSDGRGYCREQNTFWAKPGDIAAMRHALRQYIGMRVEGSDRDVPRWPQVAESHLSVYRCCLSNRTDGAQAA